MPRFASVLLVDPRGWVLLQERDEHPAIDPDRWSFVGGHLDEGEEFEPAAYRELAEETGIALPPGRCRCGWTHGLSRGDRYRCRHAGLGRLDGADRRRHRARGRAADRVVDPAPALGLDLGASASRILPEFLDSDRYKPLAGR